MLLLAWHGLLSALIKDRSGLIFFPATALPLLALGLLAGIQGSMGVVTFWGDVFMFGFYMTLCVMCLALGFASGRQALAPGSKACDGDYENPALTFLAFTLTLGAFASAVVAFAQVFELWENATWINRMPELRRPGGNLGQPNHLATLLVMGMASLVFLHQSKKLGGVASGLLLLLLSAGIAATESRAGALSLLALLCWWLLKRRAIGDPTPVWVGVVGGIAFVGMFWAWPHLLNAMDLFAYQAGGRVSEGSLRFQVWPQLLQAVAMRPWTGWGFHQVAAAHNAVADGYAVSEPYSYSHNLVLDLALWVGLPLTTLLVGVTAVWLWRRVRAANQLLPWYGLAVALPLAVHSMLEYPFAYAYFLTPVMFLLGAVEASLGVKPLVRVGVKPVAAMLLVATAGMALSVIEYVAIEEDFRIVRFEALRIGKTPPNYQRPNVVLLTQLDALLIGGRIIPKPDMTADELDMARKVALRFPWPATQNRYALSLALNGYPDEAVRQLRVMLALHGEKNYAQIKEGWVNLANEKYPQLRPEIALIQY